MEPCLCGGATGFSTDSRCPVSSASRERVRNPAECWWVPPSLPHYFVSYTRYTSTWCFLSAISTFVIVILAFSFSTVVSSSFFAIDTHCTLSDGKHNNNN